MKKRKFKRFFEGGVGDSNEGMKEAYDARVAADETKRIADEAKRIESVENEGSKVSEGERVSMTPLSKPTPPAAPAKPRVVSKAELEKSGMSLRDFMNKERGLTRRADSKAPAKAESKAESKAAPKAPVAKAPVIGGPTPARDPGGVNKRSTPYRENPDSYDMSTGKRGGIVKKMASGGTASSASRRGDGIAQRGKTRGKVC